MLLFTASLAKADIDWRTKGAVTSVKNQGQLCASWAFAVTGVLEGAWAIQAGKGLPNLSEQQLVDCASPACGGPSRLPCNCAQIGCFFNYVRANGSCRQPAYPYTARVGQCETTCTPLIPSGFASNWQRLNGEAGIAGALASGPVLARLEVGDNGQTLQSFLDYHSGVYTPTAWDASVVQWVLIIGETSSFFIVKNSFGTSWGATGYVYLGRGANLLGVGNFAYALQPGPATSGACALPDDTCFEMSAEDCTVASGTFGGVGTFCPTTAPEGACAIAPAGAPTLTPQALTIGVALLAVTAASAIRRRTR